MTHTTDANDRMNRPLDTVDSQIADLLREEAKRQATGLELIPSENLVSVRASALDGVARRF